MRLRARARLLAALVAAACSSDPTGGGEILVVAQIDVQPPGATIVIGATQQLSATPKTSSGITVPNRTVTWSSEDQGIATVSTSGLVTGVSVGAVVITARVDEVIRNVTMNVTPKPVATVSVEPPEASLAVGGTQQLIATPRDAQGQPLQNRPVTYSSDNPGVATVSATGLVQGVAAGGTTVRATSEGRTGTSAITVTPRPATRLGFTSQPASGTAGQALAPIRVAVQDELGVTVADAITTITLSIADNTGGGTLGGTVTVNAVAGIATFNSIQIDKSGSGYTLRASAAPLTPAVSHPFNIGPAAAAKLVVKTQPPAAAQSGTPLAVQPVIQVSDANGNAVLQAGVAVAVQVVGAGATLSGNLTAQTEANGLASFTNLTLTGSSGNYFLRFTAPGLTEVISEPVTLAPGVAAGLLLSTPPSSSAQSGVPFVQQPVVQLRDVNDNPVAQAGVPVSAASASGGGTLSGQTTVTTNAAGQAAFANLALTGPAGGHTLVFSSAGLGQVVSPTVLLVPGAVTKLVIKDQPSSSASNGTPFPQQPSVQLFDDGGNPVAQAGVVVTASVASVTAALSGTLTATTNSTGLATFTNLALLGTIGSYRIRFNASGLTGAESSAIVLGAGVASRLQLTTQPAGAANGVPLSQQPSVQLTDESGNPVSTAGIIVTAALASGPGGLDGTLTASTNAAGTATFTDLTITGSAGSYTIGFTAPGFAQVTSAPMALGAGAPTQLTITTQPSTTAASRVAFAPQPVIQLRDGSNNPVALAGVPITATIATGGGTLNGTVTVNTDASGVATFTNLSIGGTIGSRTLQFTSPGLVSVTSTAINITPGAAIRLGITTQPSPSASGGTPFTQQPVVQVQDLDGNAVAQGGTAVTATIETGVGGALSGTTVVVTSGAGAATYTNLSLSGASGGYTLRFAAAGLNAVISNTISLGAGAATKLAITTQPSATTKNGDPFIQQPVIQLQDAASNPVAQAGVVVTVTIQSGDPTLSGTLNATTNASGQATFTNLEITGLVGNRTLIFASGGLVSVTSNPISVTPGDPAVLEVTTPPPATAQSGVALTTQPAVHLEDQSGNTVSQAGVSVTASIASGGGTLGGTTIVATNASGVATYTNLSISGLIGTRTLSFNATGITGVTSGNISLTAGPADKLGITTQPGTPATNGSPLATQPRVQVQDAAGNAVSQAGILVTATIGAGSPAGLLTNATATTDGSGLATFSGLTITGVVGTYTLQFSGASLNPTPLSSGVVLGAGAATALTITTQPGAAAQSGIAIPTQPAIQLRDQSGNAVGTAGVTVTAVIATDPGGTPSLVSATANTNGSGLATFSGLAITGQVGDYTLQFTSGSLNAPTSNTISLSAGNPATLEMFTEPSTPEKSGDVFGTQPVVRARDGAGNNVSGAIITAAIASGNPGAALGGTLTATTASNGRATFTNLSIAGLVGDYTLQFTTPGAASATSQSITLTPGDPSKLVIATQPSAAAQNDVAFPTQPVIHVTDAGGNVVTDNAIVITAAIASGGGTLGGTLTAATVSGVATFTNLKITGTVGTRTLEFTSGSLDPATSGNIVVSAGIAKTIILTTAPPNPVQNGAVLVPNPVVDLRDISGNDVDSAGVNITVSITAGAGTLAGTLSHATGADGRATFNDLTITGAVGDRTLSFSGTSLTAAQTIVGVSSGPPVTSEFVAGTEPESTAQDGVPLPTQPQVQLRDQSGNAVAAGFDVNVTVTAGWTLGGATTVPTNGAGIATFTNLQIQGPAGGPIRLTFNATGVATPLESVDITLSSAVAAAVAWQFTSLIRGM